MLIKLIIALLLIFHFYYVKKSIDETPPNSPNSDNIKITVFLAIYNKGKYLKRSIGSIQQQTIKEVEIIAINDGSTDNTLEILKEMSEKDSRIKIINNGRNRGPLYSRAMGILNSRGEYLLSLDPDDKYQGPKNFKYLYNRAKKLNVDIVNFVVLYYPSKITSEKMGSYYTIIRQPRLFEECFFKDCIIKDYFITNKLVKREVFMQAYKEFEKYVYGVKWHYFEDNIWSILVYKYANSSIFVSRRIYCYYLNNQSAMMNRGSVFELENMILRNKMYDELFKPKEYQKFLFAGYSELVFLFEKNINITIANIELKQKVISLINNFTNNYNVTPNLMKRINSFIGNIT